MLKLVFDPKNRGYVNKNHKVYRNANIYVLGREDSANIICNLNINFNWNNFFKKQIRHINKSMINYMYICNISNI